LGLEVIGMENMFKLFLKELDFEFEKKLLLAWEDPSGLFEFSFVFKLFVDEDLDSSDSFTIGIKHSNTLPWKESIVLIFISLPTSKFVLLIKFKFGLIFLELSGLSEIKDRSLIEYTEAAFPLRDKAAP
jgi:hypothetical protein